MSQHIFPEVRQALDKNKSNDNIEPSDPNVNEQGSTEQSAAPPLQLLPSAPPKVAALFDGLVDLVDENGDVSFLVKIDEKLDVGNAYEIEGDLFTPPSKNAIPFLLPRANEVMGYYKNDEKLGRNIADARLFDEMVEYEKRISELPSEGYYILSAAWVMHTYLQETIEYSPMLCMYSEPERGKSRTGKGMINVAYRGIHLESLREAHIIRLASAFHASLFIDVVDVWRKAEKSNSEDIILHRYEKGIKTARVSGVRTHEFGGLTYYDVFGPTVIATNVELSPILETRAIHINMPISDRVFDDDLKPASSLPLKEKLTAFRARHLGERLPDANKPTKGRLGDIMRPLLQVIKLVKPECEESLAALVVEFEKKRKEERMLSFEAELIASVGALRKSVRKGALSVEAVVDNLNRVRHSNASKLTPQKIGRSLKTLGFDRARLANGNSAILYNERLVQQLITKYGLALTPPTSKINKAPAELSSVGVSEEQSKVIA